jgi:glycerol-3-phosphate dehydrogenase (NAD(P)+)
MGGNPQTFSGLSGLGDLVATCCSPYSRNRKFGELIGKGYSVPSALEEVGMVVEGYYSCPVTYRISQSLDIEIPIIKACYHILEENCSPLEEISTLMGRSMKDESEIW